MTTDRPFTETRIKTVKRAITSSVLSTTRQWAVLVAFCLATMGCGQDMTIAPEYSNPQGTADRVTAQSLVRICASAQQAGWDFVSEGGGDVAETVRLIVEGHRIEDSSSPFNGTSFRVPGLSAEAQARAVEILAIENGKLVMGSR